MPKIFRIDKMKGPNDGTRSLFESIFSHEIIKTLKFFIKTYTGDYVLIGGVAQSYYGTPRITHDIDLLYSSENIPTKLKGFEKISDQVFRYRKNQIEVQFHTSNSINLREELSRSIFDTALDREGIKIASPSGLIVSKLGRFNYQDRANIDELIITQQIDLTPFHLTEEELSRFLSIKNNPI